MKQPVSVYIGPDTQEALDETGNRSKRLVQIVERYNWIKQAPPHLTGQERMILVDVFNRASLDKLAVMQMHTRIMQSRWADSKAGIRLAQKLRAADLAQRVAILEAVGL